MSVLIFDVEATDREHGEIIEAAWLRLGQPNDLLGADPDAIGEPLHIAERFSRRYQPRTPTTYGALAVHGILPSELEGCEPSASFKLPDGTDAICGHSIDYDWELAGKPNVRRICTFAMSKHLWPDADSHSQVALIYLTHGATPETREMVKAAHGALTDVHLSLALLTKILQAKPEIRTWSALHAYSEECRIPIKMPLGRNRGALIAELETGEMEWYLARDFIDPYLRKAFENELDGRREPDADDDEDDGPASSETVDESDEIPF